MTCCSAVQKLKASVTPQISEASLFFLLLQPDYEVFFLSLAPAAGLRRPGCPPTPLLSRLLLTPIAQTSHMPL